VRLAALSQALMRPVAMMTPDLAMIAEVMLAAEGFREARALARKTVTLYSLMAQQLSKQVGAAESDVSACVPSPRLRRMLCRLAAFAKHQIVDLEIWQLVSPCSRLVL
jgi:Hydrolytic ATP binding site of dynein motor region